MFSSFAVCIVVNLTIVHEYQTNSNAKKGVISEYKHCTPCTGDDSVVLCHIKQGPCGNDLMA